MPVNILETADQLRREANAFAAFTNALAARFDPLGRVELRWRVRADVSRIGFKVNGLPPWSVSPRFLAGRSATALDWAELHFRQADRYREWTKSLA